MLAPQEADSSPLSGIGYPYNAGSTWRWIECAEDKAVSAFVAAFVAAEPAAQHAVRTRLDVFDQETITTFAGRRAFAAIRTGAASVAASAFDALSVLDMEHMTNRVTLSASMAAYAAATAGTSAATTASAAIARAVGEIHQLLSWSVSGDVVDLEARCQRQVVDTTDGKVVIGLSRLRPFAPTHNLIPTALRIAAILDEDPSYQTIFVELGSKFPPAPRGDERMAAAVAGITGVVSISACTVQGPDRRPYEHTCSVALADAASPNDANILGAAPPSTSPSSVSVRVADGWLVGHLLAHAIGNKPTFETVETLARLVPAIKAALADGMKSGG